MLPSETQHIAAARRNEENASTSGARKKVARKCYLETVIDEDDKTTTQDFVSASSGRPMQHAIRHGRKVSCEVSLSSSDDAELVERVA